jgi:hypothetical protein
MLADDQQQLCWHGRVRQFVVPRGAISGHSCQSAVEQFPLGSLNSLTADLRECSQMTSNNFGGMVEYDNSSCRAGRSADIRVNPR